MYHPYFTESRQAEWTRCRDAYGGASAVKAKGQAYLPQLSAGHTDYQSYLGRAPWYPAYSRTIDGMVGAVVRKPATMLPDDPVWADVAGYRLPVAAVAEVVLREALLCGRVGLVVDVEPTGCTRWRIARAEDILTWDVADDGALTYVAIRQTRLVRDGRTVTTATDVLHFEMRGAGVVVWRESEFGAADDRERRSSEVPLLRGSGQPLMRIPVVIADMPTGSLDRMEPGKPPLLDLADLCYQHYRTGADLEHALHWVALPQPWIAAPDADVDELYIGGPVAWNLGKDGRAGMLEISGAGLAALDDSLKRKQGQMAAIGAAAMMGEPARVAETAEAVRLKSHGETALLHSVANMAERAVGDAMAVTAEWLMLPDPGPEPFQFNRDWISLRLGANDVSALLAARQAGEISQVDFIAALVRGEWLEDGATAPPSPTPPENLTPP